MKCLKCKHCKEDIGMNAKKERIVMCKLRYTYTFMQFLDSNEMGFDCTEFEEKE